MARDVAKDYCETKMGTPPPHKLTNYVIGKQAYDGLSEQDKTGMAFRYMLEVSVDDFGSLVIPTSCKQLCHVSTGTMTGIHDVFPDNDNDFNDPIFEKKLKQLDGEYSTTKTILGFDFDGVNKTLWLEEAKHAHLLTVLHGWIRSRDLAQPASRPRNLKQWWLRFIMLSRLYRQGGDSSPHATRSFRKNLHWYTSSGT
jgi:hypothetical protein